MNKLKWLWLAPYLAAVLVGWQHRDVAYRYIPTLFRETPLADMVFAALALVGMVCLVEVLRYPFRAKKRFQRAFERKGYITK